MSTLARVRIARYTVDALHWEPITAPVAANSVRLYDEAGSSDFLRRTDPDDSSTEATQSAGLPYDVSSNPPFTSAARTSTVNFALGDIVCWARVSTGTVTLLGEFL